MDDSVAIPFFEALTQANTSLKTLNLRRGLTGQQQEIFKEVSIGDGGALAVARLLMCHPNISNLDLSWNCLGDVGARHLATTIPINKRLVELYLDNCGFTPAGMTHIFKSLTTNKSLMALTLDGSAIKKECATSLKSLLLENSTLKYLALFIEDLDGLKALYDGIEANKGNIVVSYQVSESLQHNPEAQGLIKAINDRIYQNQEVNEQATRPPRTTASSASTTNSDTMGQ